MIDENSTAARNELDTLRVEIDSIDAQLTALLDKRFDLTRAIGAAKTRQGLVVKDAAREQVVIDKVISRLNNSSNIESIVALFRLLIQVSVDQQERALNQEPSPFSNNTDNRRGDAMRRPNSFNTNIENANPTVPYKHICIIGTGLIGGALARKVKTTYPDTTLNAVDLPASLSAIKASQLFENCFEKIEKAALTNADLVVIACPANACLTVLEEIAPYLHTGQTVIDLCSVKNVICALAEKSDLRGASFVGVHPFFGTEKCGFENSSDVPLEGKTVCLVPTSKSDAYSLEQLRIWFESMQFAVFRTDASSHDATVAITSHLVQLLSTALGSVIHDELLSSEKDEHLKLSGGALSGFARLMASSSQVWSEIVEQNHELIEQLASKVIAELNKLIDAGKNDKQTFNFIFAKGAKVHSRLRR